MTNDDIEKAAFRARCGQHEWLAMPLGLANAPATLMTIMNEISKECAGKFVLALLDDALMRSKNKEDHLKHLQLALEKLRQNKLYGKPRKREFAKSEMDFIGHRAPTEGLKMQRSKIKAIQDWKAPKNAKEIQSFLGLANCYRKFIEIECEIVKRRAKIS